MNEEKITIEFKYPWTMLPLENADEWINAVTESLRPNDPLHGKQIFVSGRHEYEQLILVDNDTDNNYAIISVGRDHEKQTFIFQTIEILKSRKALAERLENDHQKAVKSNRG